jgi:broad specificity phosphatase PhoE
MSAPTRLFLLRHAEVETRYHQVFGGRIDMNLSPRGETQATALAEYLRSTRFDVLYVSPMKRARQTLSPLLEFHPTTPRVLEDLREVDFGDWTGLSWQQLHDRHQISAFRWLDLLEQAAIPNAECGRTFRTRVEGCVRHILAEHPGQSVVVLCHGGVIRMILAILLDLSLPQMAMFEIEYASVTHLDHHPQRTEVRLLNFTPWRDLPAALPAG